MWKESEMNNAFGRRIARDMPYMPRTMRWLFYIAEGLSTFKYRVSLALMFLCMLFMVIVLNESYLGFGAELIVENEKTKYVFGVLLLLPAYWVTMLFFNICSDTWYRQARKNWKS